MANDDWKYTDVPANSRGKPLKWDRKNKEWTAYDGIEEVKFPELQNVKITNQEEISFPDDYPDEAVKAKLESAVSELESVKSELEAIKSGTLKVENDDLVSKIDSLLDKQESLENKLDGVIEDGSVNTQVTGSNMEEGLPSKIVGNNKTKILQEDEELAAGSTIQVVKDFSGSRVGLGIRFSENVKHRVRFLYVQPNSKTAISGIKDLIKETKSSSGDESFVLNLSRGNFLIQNRDTKDVILRFFVITEFMSGGKDDESN